MSQECSSKHAGERLAVLATVGVAAVGLLAASQLASPEPASAAPRGENWYASTVNGTTWCAYVRSRTAKRLSASVHQGPAADGILNTYKRDRGQSLGGPTYRWTPNTPFNDWFYFTFLNEGKLKLSYEGSVVLRKVSQRSYGQRCSGGDD